MWFPISCPAAATCRALFRQAPNIGAALKKCSGRGSAGQNFQYVGSGLAGTVVKSERDGRPRRDAAVERRSNESSGRNANAVSQHAGRGGNSGCRAAFHRRAIMRGVERERALRQPACWASHPTVQLRPVHRRPGRGAATPSQGTSIRPESRDNVPARFRRSRLLIPAGGHDQIAMIELQRFLQYFSSQRKRIHPGARGRGVARIFQPLANLIGPADSDVRGRNDFEGRSPTCGIRTRNAAREISVRKRRRASNNRLGSTMSICT